jgi:hypothetical protein
LITPSLIIVRSLLYFPPYHTAKNGDKIGKAL